MGMTSSKPQSLVLPLNLESLFLPLNLEESAVSVCHHMTTLLASSDTEVRQTALHVLAQMTNAAATPSLPDGATSHLEDGATSHLEDGATSHHLLDGATSHHLLDGDASNHLQDGATSHHLLDGVTSNLLDGITPHHLLDRGCMDEVAEAVLGVLLHDATTAVPLDTLHVSLQILNNIFSDLGEETASKVCAESDLYSLISKLSQLESIGAKLFCKMRRSPSFQSNDNRYGSHEGGGDSIRQTIDSGNNNWNVPIKSGRSNWDQQTNGGFCSSNSSFQVMEVSGSRNAKSARVMMKKMDDDEPMAPVEVKSAAVAAATRQQFLVRGQKLFETHGVKTELWMPQEETFLSKSHLATLICGILNSPSGGTIYIGVGEDGIVWGLDLDRSGRDLLRRNLAKVMKDNIHPIVLCPSKVSIDFVPVDCQGGDRAAPCFDERGRAAAQTNEQTATVVVVNIAAFPAGGIAWETPRIYQAGCLAVVELEGRYVRTEGVSSTFNLKMKPMDLLKEQKKILNM